MNRHFHALLFAAMLLPTVLLLPTSTRADPGAEPAACRDPDAALKSINSLGPRLEVLVELKKHCWNDRFTKTSEPVVAMAKRLLTQDDLDPAVARQLLEGISTLDQNDWQAMKQLAELEDEQSNWVAAERWSVQALLAMPSTLQDEAMVGIAEELNDIRDKARSFHVAYLRPPPKSRDSSFQIKHRGELVLRLLQEPLEFEYDSIVLTSKGQAAMQQLIENVKSQISSISTLTILGHTDETGTAAYNCDLSRRRAEFVRSELAQADLLKGLKVRVVPQGEQNPRRGPRLNGLNPEQRQQLDRRVQWTTRAPSERELEFCQKPTERAQP